MQLQSPLPLVRALPFAYAAHIADEFFAGTGLYTWVGAVVPFSAGSFLGVNFIIISFIAGHLSPGFFTGAVLLLPLAFAGFRGASAVLPRRDLVRGIAAGLLLFASQDLWRVAFNVVFLPAAQVIS